MNKDEKEKNISAIRHSICEMALGDIIRASEGGAKMGAFILASCLIDLLVSLSCGRKSTRNDYIKFVNESFKGKYDGKLLYEDMRCRLVHNYSTTSTYFFTDKKPEWHLKRMENTSAKSQFINLEDFIEELKVVINDYLLKLEAQDSVYELAWKKCSELGCLGVYNIQVVSTDRGPIMLEIK